MSKKRLTLPAMAVLVAVIVVGSGIVAGCSRDKPASPAKSEFVNDRCPMMGSKIDLANVPADLIREYKGQKVAFCCAGCPVAWDKLGDAERQTKLDKVRSR